MEKRKGKRTIALLGILAVIAVGVVVWCVLFAVNRQKEETLQAEGQEGRGSSKDAVLSLESDDSGRKIPAGDREKMTRLTIVREGVPVFEMKREPSENEENFEEWYLTKPYSYKQLVNVFGLYDFLAHYTAWDFIKEADAEGFLDSGMYVEEEFEDTGALRFEIGQQNEAGNYFVRADYSGKVYEVEKMQVEAMTGLEPRDFMMGIASLVYLTTVGRLEIQTERVSVVFDIETASDNSQTYRREGSVCGEKGFKEMYSSILSVVIAGEAGEVAEESLGVPVLCIHFFRNSEQLEAVEVSYYPYDEDYYLIERNGVRQFLAEKETVNQVVGVIEKFCSP